MRALIVFSSFIAIAYASSSSRGASITVYCAAYGDGFWPLSNLGESPNFTIISNYMGQDYYNDTTCTTTLLTGDLPTLIVVLLEHFDVELSDRCTKDWLCVRGIRLCGIWTGAFPFAYTLPANTTFTLKFQSDSAVTRPGFKGEQIWPSPVAMQYQLNIEVCRLRQTTAFFMCIQVEISKCPKKKKKTPR